MKILDYIDALLKQSGFCHPVYEYTHGKCLVFAKLLYDKYDGCIMFVPIENHFVFQYNGKLYDATGNVTNRYFGSKLRQFDSLTYKQLIGYEGA